MTLRPLLLALFLIALTGAAMTGRAAAAPAAVAGEQAISAVSSASSPADVPATDGSWLAGEETSPEAPFGVEAHAAASVLRAGADALRHAPASAPPAAGHGAPSSPPPER